MIVPERIMRTGKVCPAFQIDDDLAEEVLKYSWGPTTGGYMQATIKGKSVYLHRFVWCLSTGSMPLLCIDHINRDKLDNRVSNLRDVTYSDNTKNGGSVKPCGSGSTKRTGGLPVGVYAVPGANGTRHRVVFRGRHVGYFHSVEEAAAAYLLALREEQNVCQSQGEILRIHKSLDSGPAIQPRSATESDSCSL
jgi:hypothetical protein